MKNTTLRSILALMRVKFSGAAIYRASFFTAFVVDCSFFAVQLAFLSLISAGTNTAWTPEMYRVFVGSFMTLDGLYMTTWFFGVVGLPAQIRSGELDLWLVRPLSPLLYVTFSKIDIGSLPVVITGMVITFVSAAQGGFLSAENVLLWFLALAMMYVLIYSLSLLLRCIAFWTTSTKASESTENALIDAATKLPMPAIKGAARWVLLFALPYGIVANFPAMCMFGTAPLALWGWAALMTALFTALAVFVWKRGLRRYESASS
ncbi:MAG: ABC-2 family transporter protein [Eubacteriales bacterium]|nr:ABC-2 family transporter protein [Eubacteriales bacterium]MDD3881802.1 ABC-2 family transporter protein [Eubacteriales bacterium]MDD4513575.1 ABC-2 family transporter protein [Eubacteriales bacterium]